MAKATPTNPSLWSRAKSEAKKKFKVSNGQVHSGKAHGKTSKRLYHLKDLSAASKKKAKK